MSTQPSQRAAYADLFERMLDPTFLLDPTTQTILEVNPAAERLIEGTQLVGRKIDELVQESGRDEFGKALRVAMRRYHPRQFESLFVLSGPQGPKTLVMDILACPMKLSDQSEVLQLIARDISFRREAEQKMTKLLEELKAANEKLEMLSNTDGMTGLHNFRYFKGQLAIEHARSSRYADKFAIVFCDIDHFKHYNDRNGHPAGDELLRHVARTIQKCVRSTDLPARYGGEEFVVLCPGVGPDGAQVLGERIRAAIAGADFPHAKAQPAGALTVSVGVSAYPGDGATAEQILEAADQAMYYSKTHGRNRVTTTDQLRILTKKAA